MTATKAVPDGVVWQDKTGSYHQKQNHRHTWVRTDSEDDADIVCENCDIDYDEWVVMMKAKGYTMEQMRRFENE